jgi:hypothetical protein
LAGSRLGALDVLRVGLLSRCDGAV